MLQIVKQLFPDFPTDRTVEETQQFDKYFFVDFAERKLFVPTQKALRGNLTLVDPFMDSLGAFAHMDLSRVPRWDINYRWDHEKEEVALELLKELNQLIDEDAASDIETRGLEYIDNRVIAIGFAYSENDAIIITALTPRVLEEIQKLYSRKEVNFIWHNGKFDCTRLKWLAGIDARIDDDTMYMHYAGINEKRGTHGLKDLGRIYLQAPDWDAKLNYIKKEWCRKNGCKQADFKYDYIPPEVLIPYHAFDCVATFRLKRVLKPLMRPNSHFIYGKIIEAANVFKKVELNGVQVDIEYLEDLELDLEKQIKEANVEIRNTAKEYWNPLQYAKATGAKAVATTSFNYKSPKQLKWLLEKVVGHPIAGTDKKVMEDLFDEVGNKFPVINAIKNIRKLTKYMDTYVQGIRGALAEDCRIHASYNLHGTETGRLSCSEPNMQNIPRDKKIKNIFIAAEGKKLVQLDYSQAELRVLAYLSGDEFLTDVYVSGRDLHDAVAEKMFGPGFTKEQRVQAKTINFGIAYGRGPASLVEAFGMTMVEAKKLIDDWFESMPKVKEYIAQTRRGVYHNECPTTPLGRERHFIITYDKMYHIQNELVNFAIQSIASDCTLFSLCEIQQYIEENGLQNRAKIIISVHDSIIIEVDDDDSLIAELARVSQEIMASVPKKYLPNLNVPFRADVEVGYKWGALEEWKSSES